jgi:hypothetical protein
MAKSALGRGLRHLLKERSSSANPVKLPERPPITPGMAALLRGGNGEAKEQRSQDQPQFNDEESRAATVRKRKLIQASMFIADILLIVLVARLAFVSHGHFGLVEAALCILALAIGAWLSCLALWMK